MTNSERPTTDDFQTKSRTWWEEVNLAGNQLVEEVKRIVHEGNIRTLRIKQDNKVLVEIPVTAAAGVGAMTVLLAPQIAVLGAIAALLTHCTLEVEHTAPVPPAAPTTASEPVDSAASRLS